MAEDTYDSVAFPAHDDAEEIEEEDVDEEDVDEEMEVVSLFSFPPPI